MKQPSVLGVFNGNDLLWPLIVSTNSSIYTVSSGGLAPGLGQHVIEYGLTTCVPLAGHRPQRPLAGSAAPRPHACPRNEEWGLDWKVSDDPARQQAIEEAVVLVRELDDSRPVVDNSGWTHVGGDLIDWHFYEADLERWVKNVEALVADEAAEIPVALHPDTVTMKPLRARAGAARGRVNLKDGPNLNSEYGMGFTSVERGWYLKWQTQELRRQNRLAGYVYTELYDIEHEMAGLFAADRSLKDLGNISPADVNAETVLVLDVVPVRPGTDLELTGRCPPTLSC